MAAGAGAWIDARAMRNWSHVGVWSGWAVVAAALAALAIVVLTQPGCSSDPKLETNACGVAGTAPAGECASIKECGAGAQNYVEVAFCENCFARSDTHFCEAGTCRAFDLDL